MPEKPFARTLMRRARSILSWVRGWNDDGDMLLLTRRWCSFGKVMLICWQEDGADMVMLICWHLVFSGLRARPTPAAWLRIRFSCTRVNYTGQLGWTRVNFTGRQYQTALIKGRFLIEFGIEKWLCQQLVLLWPSMIFYQWLHCKLTWSSASLSFSMTVRANLPKPVVIPYTTWTESKLTLARQLFSTNVTTK